MPSAPFGPDEVEEEATCGVPKIETLDKAEDAWDVRLSPRIPVAPFGSVTKERGVPEKGRGLLVPLPWVPREVSDESRFKKPVELGFLVPGRGIFGHFQHRAEAFLGVDLAVVVGGEGECLVTRNLDAVVEGGLFELDYVGLAWVGFEDIVHPV
ncbi:unnamed protein product [Sphagnum balticum]